MLKLLPDDKTGGGNAVPLSVSNVMYDSILLSVSVTLR